MIRCEKIPNLDNLGPEEDEDKLPAEMTDHFSDMKEDELLLFKLFDNAKDTGDAYMPHLSMRKGKDLLRGRELRFALSHISNEFIYA
jgi:hypothetical protein